MFQFTMWTSMVCAPLRIVPFESCDSKVSFKTIDNSDGTSESIFCDSSLLRFDFFFCFSLRNFWRFQAYDSGNLVAPYCAIPRDYLSDTPLLRGGAIPLPPSTGVSQRYLRDTLWKTRQVGATPPSAMSGAQGS